MTVVFRLFHGTRVLTNGRDIDGGLLVPPTVKSKLGIAGSERHRRMLGVSSEVNETLRRMAMRRGSIL